MKTSAIQLPSRGWLERSWCPNAAPRGHGWHIRSFFKILKSCDTVWELCWNFSLKLHTRYVVSFCYRSQMSNFSEPQSLLKEIAMQTSGELTSVEVITYVEALSRSAEKDYAVKPSAVNSTLTVIFSSSSACFTLRSRFWPNSGYI